MDHAPDRVRLRQAAGRWVLLATVLGSALAFVDATVVTVALPAIGRRFGADAAALQWTVNGYALSLAALILLGGSLGDRYGRRRVFTIGMAWFALASLLCGVAPSVEVLIGARVLQGVGGALLTPGALAILQAVFVPADRGRAIGAWSGLGGIAGAVGPFLGGWLVQAASWRLVFLINVPLAAVAIAVALRHVPESRDPGATHRPDATGAALAAAALGGLAYAFTLWPGRGPGAAPVLAGLVVGAAALAGFVLAEHRSRHPMLPLGLFASRTFTAVNLATFALYAALGGVFFLVVIQLQVVAGYAAVVAGAALIPITVLMLLLSAPAGGLAGRIGPRLPMTVGPLVGAVGLVLLSRIGAGTAYLTGVLPAAVVLGLGLSATVAPLTATALGAVDERHAGLASGVNNAVARAGGLLAVAVLPLAAGIGTGRLTDPAALARAYPTAMLICAGLFGAAAVIAVLGVPGRPARRPSPVRSHCAVGGTPLHPETDRPNGSASVQ
ncbi:MFS transporter [Rhizomonospora bruguierae]|uniref:MFS transporter n=1 Tax=Rhizomonospora bruguierae TaxID=1581705 RepID=UPI001BCC29DC|nr:MFS transporter [Micromonospora sp. NBRC 107566]